MNPRTASLGRQHGLSLVELLVALTIGLLLIAGLALMFGNASRSNQELDRSVQQIENGRYAVDLLTQEISLAGFYGTVPSKSAETVSDACISSTALAARLVTMQSATLPIVPFPIEGITQDVSPTCLSGLSRKANTPVLVVRRLDTQETAVASMTNDVLYVQTSHNTYDNYTSYRAAVAGTSDAAGFTLKQIGSSTAALNPVRRFISRLYFVADCSDCSGAGDGIPTLKMLDLNGTGYTLTPLVEGVEHIGFDFGIDSSGNDGIPDEWYGLNGSSTSTAEGATMAGKGWANVMAVRVHLVSRNLQSTSTTDDTKTYSIGLKGTTAATFTPSGDATKFKRRAYSTLIRLNSWAGQRES